MKILLVGNYEFDGSISMQIWANALERELRDMKVDVLLISPRPVLGRLKPSSVGVGKWLGYIDRYLLFPRKLRAIAASADIVHMCDNASAVYCAMLKGKATVVTCNDMIAARGALGELPDVPVSPFGRYLQRWVCSGLKCATRVACISQSTFDDASRILGRRDHLRVILDALNYPFQPLTAGEADRRLAGSGINGTPFLLHVGGNQARKNRDGILRIFAIIASQMDLQLIFAGAALTDELIKLAKELSVFDRIVQVVRPDVKVIEALYNRAMALIFPSRYEGFGWPPIEAQACGCPVIASDIPPLKEVIGQSGLLHSLDDEQGMATSIQRLAADSSLRDELQRRGFDNVKSRFGTARMMEQYVSLYHEAARHNER